MMGTPTDDIAFRAAALSPITRICSAVGPMNAIALAALQGIQVRGVGDGKVAGLEFSVPSGGGGVFPHGLGGVLVLAVGLGPCWCRSAGVVSSSYVAKDFSG